MNGYVLYGYMLLSHKANKQKTRYFNLARFTCKYVTCNTQTTCARFSMKNCIEVARGQID